jgi:predicted ferric reductase
MLIFLTGNVVCVAIGSRDSTVIRRLAIMSVINLVPLALGGHMNFIASRCRIRPQNYERMHRWVGKVAILEGLIHSVMAALSNVPSRRSPAIVAAVVVAALSICSNVFIRRYFYELFRWLHLILAGALFITLWFHTRSGKVLAVPKIYTIAAACLWFSAQILRLLNLLHRNPPLGTQKNRATVMEMPGAFHICVKLAQPWKFRAGEYVYLTLPGLSLTARVQSHPAVVAWWYKSGDAEGEEKSGGTEGEKGGGAAGEGSHVGRPDTIVLIVRPRSGATQGYFTPVNFPEGYSEGDFTNGLRRVGKVANWKTMLNTNFTSEVSGCLCNSIEQPIRMKAIIEGPYGEELELGQYGTVLLFATGVGISPQIAYTRRLLEKYRKWDSKIQRIALFWELESESG